jgi:hypothetical protein
MDCQYALHALRLASEADFPLGRHRQKPTHSLYVSHHQHLVPVVVNPRGNSPHFMLCILPLLAEIEIAGHLQYAAIPHSHDTY